MNKKFFLAAFAAVALTMGFTACSDDENETVKNGVKETFSLKVDADEAGDDMTEVYEAYYDAAGIAKYADVMTVDIQGKDSADCAQKFIALLKKAEAKFTAKTNWEERVCVVAQDSKYTEVYRKYFGANSENGGLHFFCSSFIRQPNIYPKRGEYIRDLFVDTWGSSYRTTDVENFYKKHIYLHADLNEFAGGRYVYLGEELTTNPDSAVTGAFVLKSTTGVCRRELVYNGITYQCSSELDNTVFPNYRNRDLNEDAGGPWLFLYTTHDPATGKRLMSGVFGCVGYDDCATLDDFKGYTEKDRSTLGYSIKDIADEMEFMPGSYAVSTDSDLDNIKLEFRDAPYELDLKRGQDMNQGAGGAWIYVLLLWEKIAQ